MMVVQAGIEPNSLLLLAQVLIVWFGEFPEVPKTFAQQAFSIAMAITGLAAFAIVLALVEQLVLQILTENVSRGSQVYEEGHFLVLAWAETQRDREVIWKILSQASLMASMHRLLKLGSGGVAMPIASPRVAEVV